MTEAKEYKTTREQCQKMIDKQPVVCPGCGGVIVPLETVDNSDAPTFWAGCEHCMTFTNGFPPMVFEIAKKMVREHNHQPYAHRRFPYQGTEAEKEYYYETQTRGTCSEVSLVLKLKEQYENEHN